MRSALAITGIGLLTPVGQSPAACMHSVRSGVSALSMLPLPDRAREWIAGGSVLRWTPHIGTRRLEEFLGIALEQAWQQCTADAPVLQGRAALIIGQPEATRPGKPPVSFSKIPQQWRELPDFPAISHIEHVRAGACNAHAALFAVARLFGKDPSLRICLVGIADSQLDIRTTRWHEDNYRLKCSYLTDGLMPAEAACFLVIEPEEYARARGARDVARIVSFAASRETATVLSDQANTATALTTAVRTALNDAGIGPADAGMVWSDLNGESYRAREWAFTEVRLGFTTGTELMHPADCHGDLGAATDANLFALAAVCHGTGWSEGKPQLVIAGSEGGFRGATVLMPPSEGLGRYLQVSKQLPRVLSETFEVPVSAQEDYRNSDDPPRAYFDWRMCENHRDDLAALHYQRSAILRDRGLSWWRLADVEDRMLRHLDAVVAAGPASMAVIADGVNSEEEGVCFAGAFLIGLLPSAANLQRIAHACSKPLDTRIAGIEAALQHAPASQKLDRFIVQLADDPTPAVRAMATRVAARRRVDIRTVLRETLQAADAGVLSAGAVACGRLGAREFAPLLTSLLAHETSDVRCASLLALLRLIPERTVAFCRSEIEANDDFDGALATCLGIAGRPGDAGILLARLEAAPHDTKLIEALGILGDPVVVPELLMILAAGHEAAACAAGEALNLISGLNAKVRRPLPRDPEDPEHLQPRAVECANTSQEFWVEWWTENRGNLESGTRWRRGIVYDVGSCIAEMADPAAPLHARDRAFTELCVQVDANLAYESDWFVARQLSAIEQWREWWHEHGMSQVD